MPDTHLPHVRAEYADIRPSIDRVVIAATHLVACARDVPRPLFANERKVSDHARVKFAEQVREAMGDIRKAVEEFVDEATAPVVNRADDCGFELPETDLTDLLREIESLERECSATCVTARAAA